MNRNKLRFYFFVLFCTLNTIQVQAQIELNCSFKLVIVNSDTIAIPELTSTLKNRKSKRFIVWENDKVKVAVRFKAWVKKDRVWGYKSMPEIFYNDSWIKPKSTIDSHRRMRIYAGKYPCITHRGRRNNGRDPYQGLCTFVIEKSKRYPIDLLVQLACSLKAT